jgi:D-alanyl-lipoteichoic acid acyltransferase DltB (MBOAT superfamily)
MLFTSLRFLFFFSVFFALYHGPAKSIRGGQNWLLLIGSYAFYAFANWKILPLLILYTTLFYGLGFAVERARTAREKTSWTALGVVIGLGSLLYFKYTNFFIEVFAELVSARGFHFNATTFSILLPVGISFWTFRLLSYVIEIGRGRQPATRNFVAFASYVAFFPSILSGPIDRPWQFIPQLEKQRDFDHAMAVDGLRQILWGLFKKIVVADQLATSVRHLVENPDGFSSGELFVGMYIFILQMYADFSGYTDMALGVSKLIGIRVSTNFKCPLFAQNIADYWRRWHISLTSWLTDYVFIPLNIKWRNRERFGLASAIGITFLLSGLWHGANETFLLWGLYHGLLYVPLIASGSMAKKHKLTTVRFGLPAPAVVKRAVVTMTLVSFGLIIFNSPTTANAFEYIRRLFSLTGWDYGIVGPVPIWGLLWASVMLLTEWYTRNYDHALAGIAGIGNSRVRMAVYVALTLSVVIAPGQDVGFVYFQF